MDVAAKAAEHPDHPTTSYRLPMVRLVGVVAPITNLFTNPPRSRPSKAGFQQQFPVVGQPYLEPSVLRTQGT
jgi:hypothetical protein